ncbi:unnamed protein product [Oppiella nova]|uniref:protein-L-isoaspartate(D-aspartate) O-methyltransferase n=1 Tax=Oppiella nova TaxID=334625 RepID=A0A7R9QGA3_9ACAR|nr:unnamed protein product [Oppiella nova]CAG2165140.1 unnamed protein product [Oppiella nova]
MGFDINRFRESDIKAEFICPICRDILEDPLLVQTCEHVFCRNCIDQWLRESQQKSCPIDRQEISDESLRPPQRSFKNLIQSLLISCDFVANGCQEWIKIDELPAHTSACNYNPVIMVQEIECPANCGAIVRRCDSTDDHNCVIYLKKIIDSNRDSMEELCQENKRLTDDNRDSMEELCQENKRLTDEFNALKTKYNHLKDEYEEAMNQLKHFCIENKKFSIDLANSEQKLSDNTENLCKLNENNASKVVTIETLKTKVESLQKNNETLIQMLSTRDTTTATDSNDNCHQNYSSELLSLMSAGEKSPQIEGTISGDITITTSMENKQLVDALINRHQLSNRRVITAMLSIDRGLFAPSAVSYALHHIRSVGYGAHTGPATYEAALLQFLEPHLTPSCKVLDIGSGTGYLTACIASMVGPKGRVIGVEHIPQLVQQSIETTDKHYPQLKGSGVMKIYLGDGRFGHSSEGPYDLIFIEPLTRRVPQKLVDQLRAGGRIVVPIGAREKDINLELFTKQANGEVVRLVLCDDWLTKKDINLELFTKQANGEVVRLVLCDDWRLMQENTPDLLEDRKLQLRSGWKLRLGF